MSYLQKPDFKTEGDKLWSLGQSTKKMGSKHNGSITLNRTKMNVEIGPAEMKQKRNPISRFLDKHVGQMKEVKISVRQKDGNTYEKIIHTRGGFGAWVKLGLSQIGRSFNRQLDRNDGFENNGSWEIKNHTAVNTGGYELTDSQKRFQLEINQAIAERNNTNT